MRNRLRPLPVAGPRRFIRLMISTEEIREVLETNLLGPMLVSKHAHPLLLKRRGGRIVNVSSLVGAMTGGMEGKWPAYRVSKNGLNGLTVYLHGEYGPRGLIANSVCPGHARTDLFFFLMIRRPPRSTLFLQTLFRSGAATEA